METIKIEIQETLSWISICSKASVLFLIFCFSCKKDDAPEPALSISSFSPTEGEPNVVVEIIGTGFSTTKSENTVLFKDNVAANILTSTSTTLTVEVPSLAISGPIAVKVGNKSVISTNIFTKITPLAITDFTPKEGHSFTTITITGNSFSETANENTVLFSNNIQAKIISATTTSITVEVPVEAVSGAISVKVGSKTTTSISSFTKTAPSWSQMANVSSVGRLAAVGFVINDKGYVGTGYDGVNYRNDFWEYDPTTNVWTQKADFAGDARYYGTGFSLNNKGYLGTGYASGNYYTDFWQYDPISNSWSQKADVGTNGGRDYAIGFSIGTKGYIGAGWNGANDKKDFWEYDPTNDKWSQLADYQGNGSRRLVNFVIGSNAYAGAGSNSNSALSGALSIDFWMYNPTNNSWTQKGDITGSFLNSSASFAIEDHGYVGTGGLASDIRKDFWMYNSVTDTWTKQSDFSGGSRHGASGFSIGNKGYFLTGYDLYNTSYKMDTWIYLP